MGVNNSKPNQLSCSGDYQKNLRSPVRYPIANRKGGAGKSTCAAHLSLEATKKGFKTILIDLDPQKTLEIWWKKREEENPFLTDIDPLKIEELITNIDEHGFDLCIIDTPGDTSINAINGIKVADLVLIPSKPTSPDLTAIGRTISMVKNLEKNYVFVITQAIARTKLALQGVAVLSEFGVVAPSTISNRISYANAMNIGSSASIEDKQAAEELKEIWNFISLKLFDLGEKDAKEKIRFNL
ncbi:ParA family protein [Rickettsia endosymbiont of Ceutorhynchus obstrictus]|uniref:ParA family protein n=1 Tax=Rickettsia endosymbiont of Ceutorhynchus obstrictus TaxID=3066249 RepID=UPI003132A9CE